MHKIATTINDNVNNVQDCFFTFSKFSVFSWTIAVISISLGGVSVLMFMFPHAKQHAA